MIETKSLTDKTWVVLIERDFDFYLTEKQADYYREVARNNPAGLVELEGNLIPANRPLIKAEHIVKRDKVKHGDWLCGFGKWHIRGQECAHGEIKSD